MDISIDITGLQEAITSLAARAAATKDQEAMHGAISIYVQELTEAHLDKNYVPRNKRGDFWARVRESLVAESDESAATISLEERGLRLRYKGGEVKPGKSISTHTGKPTKALAVPSDNVPISGGKQIRPARAGVLAFIRAKTQGDTVGYLVEGVLVIRKRNTKRGAKGSKYAVPKVGGNLMYTLRKITRHNPDPNIIPTEAEYQAAAIEALEDYFSTFN